MPFSAHYAKDAFHALKNRGSKWYEVRERKAEVTFKRKKTCLELTGTNLPKAYAGNNRGTLNTELTKVVMSNKVLTGDVMTLDGSVVNIMRKHQF